MQRFSRLEPTVLRVNRALGAKAVLGAVLVSTFTCTATHAIDCKWAVGSGNWSVSGNWMCNVVPCNQGGVTFTVLIPSTAVTVTHDAGVTGCPSVDPRVVTLLTLENGAVLSIADSTSLSVEDFADLCGIMEAHGDFTAVGPSVKIIGDGADLSCGTARVRVHNGASVTIDANSYDSTLLAFSTTLLSADGANSTLDLSSLSTWDAAFVVGGGARTHTVIATDSGVIDMRNLPAIPGPGNDERLEFRVNSGGSVDLTSVQSITGTESGRTRFFVDDPGTLQSLPSLGTADHLTMYVTTGGVIEVNGPQPFSYSSTGLLFSDTLFSADGMDSKIDLSAMTTWDAAFVVGGGARTHTVIATDSGVIDMRNLPAIPGPGNDERLEFRVNSGGSVDLTSVQSITGTESGRTRFFVDDPGTLQSLPSLGTADHLTMYVTTGGVIEVNGPQPFSYSSTGLLFSDTLFSADGMDSKIDLSAMTTWDAAFVVGNAARVHTVSASNSGVIDMCNLPAIMEPGSDEKLDFLATTDGSIDLSSLGTIEGSSGFTRFLLRSGGRIDTAGIEPPDGTLIDLENVTRGVNGTTTMHVSGNLNAATHAVTMNLDHAETLLDVDGSLLVGANSTLIAAEEAALNVGGRLFCYPHTDEQLVKLGSAIVHFDGKGTGEDPQRCEVGGLDLNLLCGLFEENFGFGQLIIGQPGQPTRVELTELIDNGNRLPDPEALYLIGLANGQNTLQILGGSTLVINELNVYLCDEGIRIKDLFPKNVDVIEYDGGFIELGNLPVTGDLNGDRSVGIVDFLMLLADWGPCAECDNCPADLDCDCSVGITDFLILLGNWG